MYVCRSIQITVLQESNDHEMHILFEILGKIAHNSGYFFKISLQ